MQQFNILHVMDNIDGIMNSKGEFDWNIINLINIYQNIKVVLISRNPIRVEDYQTIKDIVVLKEVPPLDEDESVDFVINNCEREIYKDIPKAVEEVAS